MSMSDDQDLGAPQGLGSQHPPMDRINASRRRWLAGALAAPAAVSLPVTASAAAFGSMSTCVENLHSHQGYLLHVSPLELDGLARTLIPDAILAEKGNINSNGYSAQPLVVYQDGVARDEHYNEWPMDGTFGKDGLAKYISPITGETYKDNGIRVERCTLMFAVNDSGDFSTDPTAADYGALPVTTSCWVSIAPLQM